MSKTLLILSCIIFGCTLCSTASGETDPYLWLEDVNGEKSLKWAVAQTERSSGLLSTAPGYSEAYAAIMAVRQSEDRMPVPSREGKYLYNFWRDKDHTRGVYRRTTMDQYLSGDPAWEVVLDIDALSEVENQSWVFQGASFLYPDADRALIFLSPGGSDARVVREFDMVKKAFVRDGFALPAGINIVAWRTRDEVYVAADFGPDSRSQIGYSRVVKRWKRGTPLEQAVTVLEMPPEGLFVYATRNHSNGEHLDIAEALIDMNTRQFYKITDSGLDQLDLPGNADLPGYFAGRLLVRLGADWVTASRTYAAGSILACRVPDLEKKDHSAHHILFEPVDRMVIPGTGDPTSAPVRITKDRILVTVMDNVVDRLFEHTLTAAGEWRVRELDMPGKGVISPVCISPESNDYMVMFTSFLSPPTLYYVAAKDGTLKQIRQSPAAFDASPYIVEQYNAPSADGTRVPYFAVLRRDAKRDGSNPAVITAYGGFGISMKPFYMETMGRNWLDRGGVFVLANIRGGGELGPDWHTAAIQGTRKKVFEDFIGVAEDVIRRKISSPKRLGISGGSNGGLTVGVALTMRPDLFGAVVCQAPVLDLSRFHTLFVGAAWIPEYGNPDDPAMWKYMRTYSPYQNLKPGASYPPVLFTASRNDDRAHPGHARKMHAKMQAMGYDTLYLENSEGGHGLGTATDSVAHIEAMTYSFLYKHLMN